MRRWVLKIACAAAAVAGVCGCVERTLTITSEPSGALVYVSSEEIGRTPVSIPFTWYGDYEIILRREGCEALKTHYNVFPPVYEIPPLDLLSALAPWTYHDDRIVHFRLTERADPSDADLLERTEELRGRNLAE